MGEEMRLHLCGEVDSDAYYDEQAGATELEWNRVFGHEKFRHDADQRDLGRAEHGKAGEDVIQIFSRLLAGTNTCDEATVFLEVIGGFSGIEYNGGVEEAEEYDERDIQENIERLAMGEIGADGLHDAGTVLSVEACDSERK